MLLKGRAWAIYDSLAEDNTDTMLTFDVSVLTLGKIILAACEQLSRRKLQEGKESIDEVARDSDNYVDDRIVFSDDMDSHINKLWRVLEKLKSADFTLQSSKCLLGQCSITHLGFHYSTEGVTPSGDKIKAIAECPVPSSAKELRSFLGFANFYWNFVPGFANISAPLNDLTSN